MPAANSGAPGPRSRAMPVPVFLLCAVVFLQAHSANELAHDNGPGSENPRAVLKITDPLDSAVRSNVEPDDPLDFPRAIPYIEQNDRGLAVHLAECQPPGHGHT